MLRSMTWLPLVPKMCRYSYLTVTCCQHFLLPKKSVSCFTPTPHFAPCYPTHLIHVQCGGYTHNLRSLQPPFVNVNRHITFQTEFLGALTVIHYQWPSNQKSNVHFMQTPFCCFVFNLWKFFQVFFKTCYCTQFRELRFSGVSFAPASKICGL